VTHNHVYQAPAWQRPAYARLGTAHCPAPAALQGGADRALLGAWRARTRQRPVHPRLGAAHRELRRERAAQQRGARAAGYARRAAAAAKLGHPLLRL